MIKLVPVLAAVLAIAGCLDSGGSDLPVDGGAPNPVDTGIPGNSTDGSVTVDAGRSSLATFSTGIGAGSVVTKSEHFKLLTKTGGSPGGSGVQRSPKFKVIGGVGPASK
jgi:hypothetical protein